MKKFILSVFSLFLIGIVSAQEVQPASPKKSSKVFDYSRPGDHVMLQLSTDFLLDAPDSISSHIDGFSRGMNLYFMLDKPFRTNPHLSVAFGLGIGSSNIFFDKMHVDVNATGTAVLPFISLDSSEYFKKYKVSTNYLDVPLELRYMFNPAQENKSIKIAIGAKVGTLINAHTKGKTLLDKNGNTINSYIAKESTKRFFNTARVVGTARIGYGHFSAFASYTFTGYLRDGAGANMKNLQVGLTLSGL